MRATCSLVAASRYVWKNAVRNASGSSSSNSSLALNVETRHVEEEVELMREEVKVERRPISADAGTTGDIRINDGEIRIPVMREEAVVEKRLVPTEEIIIRKTAVRDTETVGADLRRERVEVNRDTPGRNREDRDVR
jgi:uncharacterized protein (TIGR02271 family)